jgi:hypothetical protein
MVVGVASRYVVERGSGFGVGFRKVVLPSGEVIYRCVKCSSVFCSLPDVESHLAVCGKKREREFFKYGYLGWCAKPDKVRVLVKNTVSSILLCGGCSYFRSFERKR